MNEKDEELSRNAVEALKEKPHGIAAMVDGIASLDPSKLTPQQIEALKAMLAKK